LASGRERRRYARRSGLLVRVSVRDQSGQVSQATVFNASEEGVGLIMESLPGSETLDIQPANTTLWIGVTVKHCSSTPSGYVVGCAFQSPPPLEILQALYVRP
jgi:hypothetical protein